MAQLSSLATERGRVSLSRANAAKALRMEHPEARMSKLIAIGAKYIHPDRGLVTVTHVNGITATVKWTEDGSRWLAAVVPHDQLTGPTHLPCPHCGDLRKLDSQSGLFIGFEEHISRCIPADTSSVGHHGPVNESAAG